MKKKTKINLSYRTDDKLREDIKALQKDIKDKTRYNYPEIIFRALTLYKAAL